MQDRSLTPKQEGFCRDYIETGNATEAYRRNYDCSKMKAESIGRKAKELYDNVKITARIRELQKELNEESKYRKLDLLDHLSKVKDEAITVRRDYTASINAVKQMSKMLGYDAPVQIEAKVTTIQKILDVQEEETLEDYE